MPIECSPAALRPHDRYWARRVGYPPPSAWGSDFAGKHYADVLRGIGERPDEALSVYVQVPFCSVRCLHCDCNVKLGHSCGDVDGYLDALERELDLVVKQVGSGRVVLQMHLGGGTPNSLTESQLLRLMEAIDDRFAMTEEADTAVNCDPRRASASQFDLMRAFGIRRVRFGVPDVDPVVQKSIGRIQSFELVRDVCAMAREAGFDSVSLDLTYGLPGQTTRSLRATVEKVIELGPDRVTCFGYAHLPGARPHQQTIGAAELPTDWHRSALFQCVVDAFAAAGYAWIGLDHFVRDNDELAVAQGEQRLRRNLLGYTTLRRTQVIALGVGGVGEVDATLVQNDPTMRDWQALVASGELPVCCGYHLSADDCRRRDAVVHLLCNLELPAALAPADAYDRLRRRAAEGLVEVAVDRIVVTSRGRLLLRELCAELDECGTGERTAWQS